MKKFKNILYVSQGLQSNSDSIGQALRLSANNHAPVTGLLFCPSLPSNLSEYQASYENSLIHTVNQQISESRGAHQISEEAVPFPLEVVCGDQPAVDIIHAVQNSSHDLVIKDAEPMDGKGFKAIDMTLLRKCPSAVWLNRLGHQPHSKRRIAVAVDPLISSDDQKALSLRLLELSCSIAESCGSRLHLLSCWEHQLERYLSDHAWIKIEDGELDSEIENARLKHREALDHLVTESGIHGDIVVHHLHGLPDDLIPDWVEENEIDVLVMGTLARNGIPGIVIGNTAENIVQAVNCSLVALKPPGFISPVS